MYYQYYLMHFGIPGMRWGVRKQRQSSNVKTSGSNKSTSQIKTKTKKAVKVGAAVAGGILAAYGASKLIKATNNHVQMKKGKEAADRILERAVYNKHWDDTTGYKEASRFARARTQAANKAIDLHRQQGASMNTRQAAKNIYNYYKKKKSN